MPLLANTHPTTNPIIPQDQDMDQDQPPSYDSLHPSPLLQSLMAQARAHTPPKVPHDADDEDVLDRLCERLVGLVKEATEAVEDGEVVIYDSDEFMEEEEEEEEEEVWKVEMRQLECKRKDIYETHQKLAMQHAIQHSVGIHTHHAHIPLLTPPSLYTSLTTYLTTRIPILKPAVEAFHGHVYAVYTGAMGYVLPESSCCECYRTSGVKKTRRVTF
ncbi:hypothetical protein SpCBS45565_g05689 [Spizellomyces sp. 'palustris']|nr:hypothetical protein SpCBS45565_g05689 [Spizellomyces sp. 'palustris']